MKIIDVRVDLVAVDAQPIFKWRTGLPGSLGKHIGGWLSIVTDAGVIGYAYSHRGVILEDLSKRRLREALVGRDPLMREAVWEALWEIDRIEEFPIYIIGLVDVALWDIAGKVAGLPVHVLLGSYRHEIPAYASTSTFDTSDQFLHVIDQCLAEGFTAVKLHAFGDAREDARLCEAVRNHVGNEVPLMYDGSAGFDLLDAVYLGRALEDLDFLYYEEPMREFSVTAYKRLQERTRVPLLVAETSDGAHMNTADFIASGCAAAVRTGASHRGGITGAMRIAHLADSFLLRAEVHGGGLVNRHLCMAISNNTYYESIVHSDPINHEPSIDARGMVSAPEAPGIGWEFAGANERAPGFPG